MQVPRDSQSQGFRNAWERLRRLAASGQAPTLDLAGSRRPEAWFLGPKAENLEELERLILDALRDQAFWRRNFHPGDPVHITEEIKRSPEYLQALDALKEGHRELLAFLKKSVPFFSMRYQGHMNWETTLPAIVGYFSAMLYNPNNVAFEGSTATTLLEILVGDDLCRMLGYHLPASAADGEAVRPWGHITCDGTVANIEAVWSARNLKLYPLAFRAALEEEPALRPARDLEIRLPGGGRAALRRLDPWSLLNLAGDEVLALPRRLGREYQIAREAVTAALAPYSVQNLGLEEFARRFLKDLKRPPVFLVPGTKHYSFPKAAALLGIGAANQIDVPVDLDARMSVADLRRILDWCLAERRPVYTVVAVIGTTEESAIDPIRDILAMREEFRQRGLEFNVHADAAWGGYHASLVREDFAMAAPPGFAPPPPVPLSRYARAQFQALGGADSITVDPHKSGYIPYPAGALCYRNSAMRDLVTFSAPVVFHGDAEPTVGIYGIEGSKPGASVAAVYLSHRVIRPSRSGYGQIIGQALFSCKLLYVRLLNLARPEDPFLVVPVPRLPAERSNEDPGPQLEFIRQRLWHKSNDAIQADREALDLLAELGPDQNILAYAFNLRARGGEVNRDLTLMNRLNRAVYDRLSIDPGEDVYRYRLIVSTTDFHPAQYGRRFLLDYQRRLGVDPAPDEPVTVLRSVVMDPWITETPRGSFLDILENEFRQAVLQAVEEVAPTRTRGY
ncbi:MAG: pyridoxal-dependent decarboxylase [Gemmataceae bacterium]|nr:pyridoxal-dependent decarboxylase [Gemmataceae bacterium]